MSTTLMRSSSKATKASSGLEEPRGDAKRLNRAERRRDLEEAGKSDRHVDGVGGVGARRPVPGGSSGRHGGQRTYRHRGGEHGSARGRHPLPYGTQDWARRRKGLRLSL